MQLHTRDVLQSPNFTIFQGLISSYLSFIFDENKFFIQPVDFQNSFDADAEVPNILVSHLRLIVG